MVNAIGGANNAAGAGATPPPDYTPPANCSNHVQQLFDKLNEAKNALYNGNFQAADKAIDYIVSDSNGTIAGFQSITDAFNSLRTDSNAGPRNATPNATVDGSNQGTVESDVSALANAIINSLG